MITLLLYQKSTKLILKNALFSIKAHITYQKQKLLSLYYNIIMRKIFSAFCLIIVFMGVQKLKIILNF